MNDGIDLPTSIEECLAQGIAKKLEDPNIKCADLECTDDAPLAWIQQSATFVIQDGRMFTRPVTMWFPLCATHAPMSDTPDEPEGEPEDTPLVEPTGCLPGCAEAADEGEVRE